MKKVKLYTAIAALALAIGGIFVTKANKTFAHVLTGHFLDFGSDIGDITNLTFGFDTVHSTRATVVIATGVFGKVLATLHTGFTSNSKKIYHF